MRTDELIYAIREKLKAYTDDTRYTDDWIMYLIRLKRAVLIRREYNQLQRVIDSEVLQTICIPLNTIDPSDCPECYTLSTPECFITRTALKIPASIELHNRSSIVSVAPVGKFDRPFSLISKQRMIYAGESKYEHNTVFATLSTDKHIYLKSKNEFYKSLEAVAVTMLMDNPDDATIYQCSGMACYDVKQDDYPLKAWMADVIIQEIVKELANLKQIPEDDTNDAKDQNS
jgi:hypothetical protein